MSESCICEPYARLWIAAAAKPPRDDVATPIIARGGAPKQSIAASANIKAVFGSLGTAARPLVAGVLYSIPIAPGVAILKDTQLVLPGCGASSQGAPCASAIPPRSAILAGLANYSARPNPRAFSSLLSATER